MHGNEFEEKSAMKQTPVNDAYNYAMFDSIPGNLQRVVEVGSSSGALARAYKEANPGCHYIGLEIDPDYAELSRRYCDEVLCVNIEQMADAEWQALCQADCWIFGDVLEHLYDPWKILARVHRLSTGPLHIVACIPNAQHWSVQARLNCGEFEYQDQGILDRTHIRWFTRITMLDMFDQAGFEIIEFKPLIFIEELRDTVLPAIKVLAEAIGADPQVAADDALARQYVIKAIPKPAATPAA